MNCDGKGWQYNGRECFCPVCKVYMDKQFSPVSEQKASSDEKVKESMRPDLRTILEELSTDLPSLMRAWEPCDNAADYKCAFCHNRSNGNGGDITHAPDCLGNKLVRSMTDLMEI